MMSSPHLQHWPSPLSLDAPGAYPPPIVFSPLPEHDGQDAETGLILPGASTIYKLCAAPAPKSEVIEPPANRVIDHIKEHYPAFKETTPLAEHVRHAMRMVQYCHTSALGGHIERCPAGHVSRVFYNSCGHRFCPRCAGRQRRKWLIERRAKILPVHHYHVVFTIPHVFNELWRVNPEIMGDILFHSATDALRALLADPKRLGAEPGMTVTVETWDERLFFHPHLHGMVTGGGLSPDGEWLDVPNPRCLVAVKPLMWEFRKRFCQAVKQALEHDQHDQHDQHDKRGQFSLPEGTTTRQWLNRIHKVNRQKWEVFIAKPPEDGGPTTGDILKYQAEDVAGGPLSAIRLDQQLDLDLSGAQLGYLKSAPMSESRLENPQEQEGQVTFRWGIYDPETGKRERDRTASLPAAEFLSRYLQHVPPSGYQAVRHYGLYTSAKKESYDRCRELLAGREPPSLAPASDDDAADSDTWIQQHTCPICGEPLIVSSSLPSSVTGRIIPRVPLGHVFAFSSSIGGGHDP